MRSTKSAIPDTQSTCSPLLHSRLHSRVPLLRFRYGAYLSKEQVAELVAPHPDTLELVNSWLEHHGISSSPPSQGHTVAAGLQSPTCLFPKPTNSSAHRISSAGT